MIELERSGEIEFRAAATAAASATAAAGSISGNRRLADALDRDGLGSVSDAVNVQI